MAEPKHICFSRIEVQHGQLALTQPTFYFASFLEVEHASRPKSINFYADEHLVWSLRANLRSSNGNTTHFHEVSFAPLSWPWHSPWHSPAGTELDHAASEENSTLSAL